MRKTKEMRVENRKSKVFTRTAAELRNVVSIRRKPNEIEIKSFPHKAAELRKVVSIRRKPNDIDIKMKKKDFIETVIIAVPIIIGQLSSMLMNVTDNMMVGNFWADSLSAASLANSVFILIAILALGAMNVVPSLVSEARGAEDEVALKELYRATIWSGLIWGIGIGILVFASSYALPYLGQPAEDVLLATSFVQVLGLATPFMTIFLALKGFFDGMEDTKVGMVVSIVGLGINLFFNWVFIFGKLGFPALGFIGSAWATFCSRLLMMIAMIILTRVLPMTQKYRFGTGFWSPSLKKMLIMGGAMGLQIFFEIAAFSGAAIMIGWLTGREAIVGRSAHQIVINMCSVTYMVTLGVSIAGSIRVGEALGRKDPVGINDAGNAALYIGIGFMACCAVLLVTFSQYFGSLYGNYNVDVQAVIIRISVIAAVFQLFDGAQCIAAGLLRGIQDVVFPTIMTFATYWVLWIPLAYYLGFNLKMGVDGIWWADVIALAVAAIALNWRFSILKKRLLSNF